jgi:hypothetical protein
MQDLFPVDVAESNKTRLGGPPAVEPPHHRGSIGRQASAYGVVHEADEQVPAQPSAAPDEAVLCALPDPIDVTWGDVSGRVIALSERAATIGAFRDANRWRRSLGKPRSVYFDIEGLERMMAVMVRTAAGRSGQLLPIEPDWKIAALSDAPAIAASFDRTLPALPASITAAIVARLDGLVREIASQGFPNPNAANVHNAPAEVLALKQRYQQICGATVRAINQVGHLVSVSRAGQSAHNPMTLRRRHMLVDDALAQLADELGVDRWCAVEEGILTDEVRRAWVARGAAEPLAAPFARNLFDWAHISKMSPDAYDDAELAALIQTHPDLAYVEQLRGERRRRETLDAVDRRDGQENFAQLPRTSAGQAATLEYSR